MVAAAATRAAVVEGGCNVDASATRVKNCTLRRRSFINDLKTLRCHNRRHRRRHRRRRCSKCPPTRKLRHFLLVYGEDAACSRQFARLYEHFLQHVDHVAKQNSPSQSESRRRASFARRVGVARRAMLSIFAPAGSRWRFFALFGAVATFTNFLEGYSTSYPNTSSEAFRHFINGALVGASADGGINEWSFTFLWSLFLNSWFVCARAQLAARTFRAYDSQVYRRYARHVCNAMAYKHIRPSAYVAAAVVATAAKSAYFRI